MNKNDYEIELFHLLRQNGYEKMSDFQVSLFLQIPESKVKRLRYECDLRYPKYESDDNYKNELARLILNHQFRIHNDRIQFAISDKMLKLYINNLLMADGRFLDTSFNANIISVSAVDLIFILEQLSNQTKDRLLHIKDSIKDGETEFPKKLSEALKDLLKETPKAILTDMTSESMSKALLSFLDSLMGKMTKK